MIGFNKVERTKTEHKPEVSCRFTNTINLIMQKSAHGYPYIEKDNEIKVFIYVLWWLIQTLYEQLYHESLKVILKLSKHYSKCQECENQSSQWMSKECLHWALFGHVTWPSHGEKKKLTYEQGDVLKHTFTKLLLSSSYMSSQNYFKIDVLGCVNNSQKGN